MKATPRTILAVATLIYLALHSGLSAAILSAVTPAAAARAEEAGKYVLGCGAALIATRIALAQGLMPAGVAGLALVAAILAVQIEARTVDVLVARTSGQARQDAQDAALLAQAYRVGRVQVAGLSPAISDSRTKRRAYASVLGLAVWTDGQLLDQVRSARLAAVRALYGGEVYRKIDASYREYLAGTEQYAVPWRKSRPTRA
jgi:hypothetical protein